MLREKPLLLLIHDALDETNGTSSGIDKPCAPSKGSDISQLCPMLCPSTCKKKNNSFLVFFEKTLLLFPGFRETFPVLLALK